MNIENTKFPSWLELCNQPMVTDSNDNNLHKKITCNYCNNSYKNITSLKCHIRNIHNSILPYHCRLCDKRQPSKMAAKVHHQLHKKFECHPCKCCEMVFYKSTILQKHMIKKHGKSLYQCNQCDKSYKSASSLTQHKKEKHYDTTNIPFKCTKCEMSYNTDENQQSHKNNDLPLNASIPIQSNKCQKQTTNLLSITSRQEIKNTNIELQNKIKNENLGLPKKKLKKKKEVNQGLPKSEFKRHMQSTPGLEKKNTGINLEPSNNITKVNQDSSEVKLKKHNYTTETQMIPDKLDMVDGLSESRENQTCIKEDQAIKQVESLAKKSKGQYQIPRIQYIPQIRNIEEPKVPSWIELCNQPTVTESNDNNLLKRTICNYCNNTYKDIKALKKHFRNVHNSILPYHCSLCDKRQPSKMAAMVHHKLHKKFDCHPCECCEMVFFKSTILQKHMIKKHGKSLYQCNQCEKSYQSTSALNQHKKVKHYNKTNIPFKCTKCEMSYNTNKNLQSHENNDHPLNASIPIQSNICQKQTTNLLSTTSRQEIKNTNIELQNNIENENLELSKENLKRHMPDIHGLLKNKVKRYMQSTPEEEIKNTNIDSQPSESITSDNQCLPVDELKSHIQVSPRQELKDTNIDLQPLESITSDNQCLPVDELKSHIRASLRQKLKNNEIDVELSNSIIKDNQGLKTKHGKLLYHQCNQCENSYNTSEHLEAHENNDHPLDARISYRSNICQKQTTNLLSTSPRQEIKSTNIELQQSIIDKSKVHTPSLPPSTSSSRAASKDDDYNEARHKESIIPRIRMNVDDDTQIPMRKCLNSSSNLRHQVNLANDLRKCLNGRFVSAKVAKAIRTAKANQYTDEESFEVDAEDINDEKYKDIPFSRATRRNIPRRQYLHEDDGDYTSDEDVQRHVKSRLGPYKKHGQRYKARSVSTSDSNQ